MLKGRLEQIADEMDATLYRSAFNPIIAEARDACHGLYHAETGATLVQGSTGLPIFVGAMAFAVKAVIDKVARDTASGRDRLKPGDTFLFNDPYDGGTHLNDFRLVRPVHRDGELFCWIASVGHWLDIGGNVPGGFNARATESYQEGVRIPPVKFIRQGKIDEDIIDILSANSRSARSNYGDLNGQLNALALGERRLQRAARRIWRRDDRRGLRGVLAPRRGPDARQPREPFPTGSTRSRIISTTTASPMCR